MTLPWLMSGKRKATPGPSTLCWQPCPNTTAHSPTNLLHSPKPNSKPNLHSPIFLPVNLKLVTQTEIENDKENENY
jgi:hypothetical protein